jgi:sugar O-acyltransferase (sialic acid O-acetyltransferase NeuD family)
VRIPSECPAIIYGASGHGKVVADILQACGTQIEGFVDDDPRKSGKMFGLKILGDAKYLVERAGRGAVAVALGIGDNCDRRLIAERCAAANAGLLTAVHPSATVAASAKIGPGVVIMAHAVINPDAVIQRGAVINTGAIVEHDCNVGSFAHLSPKVAIGGNVQIGDLSWLGIGVAITPGVKVGIGSIVGAGATVVTDVDDWVVAVGTPARVLRKLEPRKVVR